MSASIARLATLADDLRITERLADDEIARLRDSWSEPTNDILAGLIREEDLEKLDAFDSLQLESVIFILDSCFRNPELTWPAKYPSASEGPQAAE